MITIEARMTPMQFRRLVLMRHFQRSGFYFYAFSAALFTALVYVMGYNPLLLLAGWVPFVLYVGFGLLNAIIGGGRDQPYFQRTRYTFAPEGLKLNAGKGESVLSWADFSGWRKLVDCYVLTLKSDQIIALPIEDVPPHKVDELEALLKAQIGPGVG